MAKGNEYQGEDFKELTDKDMNCMHDDLDDHLAMQATIAEHDEGDGDQAQVNGTADQDKATVVKHEDFYADPERAKAARKDREDEDDDGEPDYIEEDPSDEDYDDYEDDGYDDDGDEDDRYEDSDEDEDEDDIVPRTREREIGKCRGRRPGPRKLLPKERVNARRKDRNKIQDTKRKKDSKVGRLARAIINVHNKHGIPLSINNQVLLDLVNNMKPDAKRYAISRLAFSAKLKTRLRRVAYELFNVGGRFLIIDRDTLIEMLKGKTINADTLVAEAIGSAAKVDGNQE